MELWIRNQNKDRLIKCQSLDILDRNQSPIVRDYLEKIELDVMIIGNDNVNLGTYTKERALEVLDELQNILNLKDMYKYDRELVLKSWENVDEEQVKIVIQQMSVYEMPKE